MKTARKQNGLHIPIERALVTALYDPLDEERELLAVTSVYDDTPGNRTFLRGLLADYRRRSEKRDDVRLCLGVFRLADVVKVESRDDEGGDDGR